MGMKKSNFNIGSIIIVIILLQLGVRGFKEINRKLKANNASENPQLRTAPEHFYKLVDRIKKLEKKNIEKSEIDRKIIIKKIDK